MRYINYTKDDTIKDNNKPIENPSLNELDFLNS